MIAVIISLHEGGIKESLMTGETRRGVEKKKKISLKRGVGRCAIQRIVEDSLFTESGQAEKCDGTQLLLTGRAPLPCPTFRFLVRLSVACLICVYFTWRIRVQSVHLSPPTLPTTALWVIKAPDRAEHREKRTMTVLMRRVLATTSISARQITE